MPGLSQQSNHTDLQPDHVLADNELAVASNVDIVGSRPITLLRVALPESGTTSVRIPGADVVPKRGEYLASPALAKRISSLPADQLGDRYGKQVGVLAPEAVEGPDSLVAVVGTDLGTVAASEFYIPPQVVTSFQGIPYENEAYRIATLIGAIAVLVPALLLVGIVTDLGRRRGPSASPRCASSGPHPSRWPAPRPWRSGPPPSSAPWRAWPSTWP